MPHNEKTGDRGEHQPKEPRSRWPRSGSILAVIAITLCATISWASCQTRGLCVNIDWNFLADTLTFAASGPEERARRILEKHPLIGMTNHYPESLLTGDRRPQ
jgi:hypothetical protein